MEQIQISAKNLGQVALKDFCSRCYWIRLKTKTLPWQIFPGIFSSIDAYTKRVVHAIIDSGNRPDWLLSMGDIIGYRKAPHWSKFKLDIKEYGIMLTGAVDDILVDTKDRIIIPDYKTAKYTETQDKLLPMYEIQLNGYAAIAEGCSISPVISIPLVYFEPITDDMAAKERKTVQGFDMAFKAHPVTIPINRVKLNEAMEKTREIYDMVKPPARQDGCKDCQALDFIYQMPR
ncbi:MAG: PD-(D/E)XK nuclease family protein [Candidatus Atribacteria bacterium]|nr:PD-(D/E)XK nuclease family protein [Candidatus Atribacteria bacterium]